MKNVDLRNYARRKGVRLWQIAQTLGVSEPTMTRKLRNELPPDEKDEIIQIINRLAKEAS